MKESLLGDLLEHLGFKSYHETLYAEARSGSGRSGRMRRGALHSGLCYLRAGYGATHARHIHAGRAWSDITGPVVQVRFVGLHIQIC